MIKALISGFLFFIIACGAQKKIAHNLETSNGPIELVLKDNYSGFKNAENKIIKNQKELKSFFSRINKMRKPGISIPVVDFKKETIFIVVKGEIAALDSLALNLVEENNDNIVLETVHISSKLSYESIVSPFLMYKIPVVNKEIIVK